MRQEIEEIYFPSFSVRENVLVVVALILNSVLDKKVSFQMPK